MTEASLPPDQQSGRGRRTLVVIMLGIIIAFMAAFLIFRPNPSNSVPTKPPTSQH